MKLHQKTFNLTGIIPVAGQPLDFNFPWHDCLQPVAQNYLAVERAVEECSEAGCRSIWIVCNDDMQPLIRHRLGDYIYDVRSIWAGRFAPYPKDVRREVPIFYVPIHPNDRDKRDCLVWSLIYGAWTADKVMTSLSQWVQPRKFYAAWPYGVMSPREITKSRRQLVSDKRVVFSHDNKTAADGEYLPFTFTQKDVRRWKNKIREKEIRMWEYVGPENREPDDWSYDYLKRHPIEERYTARWFKIEDIIDFPDLQEEEIHLLTWFYNISGWEGYCEYLGSEERKEIKNPGEVVKKYHEFNPVGKDWKESS